MPNDNVLTEQIRAMCNAHVVTMGDDFALGADRLAKRILTLLATHPVQPEPRAEVMLFADNDERDEFIRVCQDFDDDGETCVDYELLMKWASNGLLDCDHFTITKKGRAAIDAARTGASS
ncbi:hypothetical protein AQ764_14365 [Burkholderia pseudomallei]|uniref:hypothetical protein n=1 Tax=Burkholderia pseudomallei TaxID=28450 RepID=UPI0009765F5A|nr:hypothetical protein [Burkholderia pseudomallei]OMT68757.1 hypothetical protein AQ764_14365 [Burkholderia pseudomallei]